MSVDPFRVSQAPAEPYPEDEECDEANDVSLQVYRAVFDDALGPHASLRSAPHLWWVTAYLRQRWVERQAARERGRLRLALRPVDSGKLLASLIAEQQRRAASPGSQKVRRRARQIAALLRRDGAFCAVCEAPFEVGASVRTEITVDHRIARARGGTDAMRNLQLAHQCCNNLKNAGDTPTRDAVELLWGRLEDERWWRVYCPGVDEEPCGRGFLVNARPTGDDICERCVDLLDDDPFAHDADGNVLEDPDTGAILSDHDLDDAEPID